MATKSSSEKDAAFYESHKDDEAVWGESQGKKNPERRRLNAMVSVRLTPAEEDALRRVARKHGLSLSAYMRKTALKELAPSVTESAQRYIEAGLSSYTGQGPGTPSVQVVPELSEARTA